MAIIRMLKLTLEVDGALPASSHTSSTSCTPSLGQMTCRQVGPQEGLYHHPTAACHRQCLHGVHSVLLVCVHGACTDVRLEWQMSTPYILQRPKAEAGEEAKRQWMCGLQVAHAPSSVGTSTRMSSERSD